MQPKTDNKQNHYSEKDIPAAGKEFEKGFSSVSLAKQVLHCDHNELLNTFKKWLPDHQPILEAGCGSGRWVIWFEKNGWQAAGLDWSSSLINRACTEYPNLRFEVGDLRAMPFRNEEFGSVVSLGAIEHSIEGPMGSLLEFRRILMPEGIAIITVPFLGPIRNITRFLFNRPIRFFKRSKLLRSIFKKHTGGRTIKEVNKNILSHYEADYTMTQNGWEFFQYHFTKSQFYAMLEQAQFQVLEGFPEFQDEGILLTFGPISGKYDYQGGKVVFSWFGKFLKKVFPVSIIGNMYCCIVKKRNDKTAKSAPYTL